MAGPPRPLDSARIIPVDGRCPQNIFGTPIAPSGYTNYVQPIISVADARVGDEPGIKGEQFVFNAVIQGSASTSELNRIPGISLEAHIENDLLADVLENIAKVVDFANIFIGSSITTFATNQARKAAATDRIKAITIIDACSWSGLGANLMAIEIDGEDPFNLPGSTASYSALPSEIIDGEYNGLGGALAEVNLGMTALNNFPRIRRVLSGGTYSWRGWARDGNNANNDVMQTNQMFPVVVPAGAFFNMSILTPGAGNMSWDSGVAQIVMREFAV